MTTHVIAHGILNRVSAVRRNFIAVLPPIGKIVLLIFGYVFTVFVWGSLVYVAVHFLLPAMVPEETAIRLQYATGDLAGAQIMFDKKPHDCEFDAAPYGAKYCHYEKVVGTVHVRRTPEGRDVSYDEGRTWSPAPASAQPTVIVSWRKVEE